MDPQLMLNLLARLSEILGNEDLDSDGQVIAVKAWTDSVCTVVESYLPRVKP